MRFAHKIDKAFGINLRDRLAYFLNACEMAWPTGFVSL